MKHLHRTLALIAALGAALAVQAGTYVRPIVGYFAFDNSDFKNKTGFGLAVGSTLDSGGNHEVELEIDQVAWEAVWINPGPRAIGSTFPMGDGHLIPVLVGYRYRTGTPDSPLRFYVGANLGATYVSGDILQSAPSPLDHPWTGSVSSWRATLGGAIGVEIRLTHHVNLDVGYRYRAVHGPTAKLRRPDTPADVWYSHSLGNLSTSVFTLGLNCSF